jgi:SAM-dependent methyltransferase
MPEEKKYHWENRRWKWDELLAHVDLLERRMRVPGRTRYWTAMKMVSGKDVLDIGCNAGIFAGLLAEQGHRVVGVELDPGLIEICRRRFPDNPQLEFRVISQERLDFEDDSFDCVVILEVLEHVREVWNLLKEIRRVLRPGGVLVISVPNAANFRVTLRSALVNIPRRFTDMDNWPDYVTDQRDHVHMWDIFTLYRMLSLLGFRYSAHDFHESKLWIHKIIRILPPLRRLSSSFFLKVVAPQVDS